MGTAWFRSGSLEFTGGEPAAGALAYFYEAGTSTPMAVYQDGAETTPHENPVEADGNGRWPLVFVPFTDTYKFVIKTAAGSTLFTADNVPNPEPFDESFEVDEDAQYQTGDYILTGKNGTRSGAVQCNGETIGSASSAATGRAHADTSALFAYLWNNYANGQAAVSGGRGASAAADFAAHKTIALPDHRGAGIVGFDDMGNSAASLLGSAPVVSGSGILAGSIIGANTHTLTEAQLAGHTHGINFTSGAESAHTHALTAASAASNGAHTHTGSTGAESAHTHTIRTGTASFSYTPGGSASGTLLASGTGNDFASLAGSAHSHGISSDGAHTHTLSGSTDAGSSHTHAVTGTSASTGSGTAHNILSRAIPVTILMKL